MLRSPSLRSSVCLAALAFGAPAAADVTAQDVWDAWKGQMTIYNQTLLAGPEVMVGDTLTVEDVTISMRQDDFIADVDVGTLTFTENGDGTVTVTVPDTQAYALTFDANRPNPSTINMTAQQSGLEIIASGEPDTMSYDMSGDSYSFVVDSITGPGAEDIEINAAQITMTGFAGGYTITQGELMEVESTASAGEVAFDFDIQVPNDKSGGVVSGSVANLSVSGSGSIPEMMELDDDMPPFKDGLAMVAGYTFGALAYSMDIEDRSERVKADVTSSGGELGVAFDYDGVAYTGQTRDVTMFITMPGELPLPFEATLGQYGFDLQVPLSRGDGSERDARIAFSFVDFNVSDLLWSLVDPQGILPRDPVTLSLDLDAKVLPAIDFLDPEQIGALGPGDLPGQVNSLTITDITVKGAGAEITGTGAFALDNDDMQTFPGFPRPEGQADFAINGINGLIDNLISMGLIPAEEAMMPRMMMGMFTVPVGDDMLTSTIEVNSDGHVLANGQRLR